MGEYSVSLLTLINSVPVPHMRLLLNPRVIFKWQWHKLMFQPLQSGLRFPPPIPLKNVISSNLTRN